MKYTSANFTKDKEKSDKRKVLIESAKKKLTKEELWALNLKP